MIRLYIQFNRAGWLIKFCCAKPPWYRMGIVCVAPAIDIWQMNTGSCLFNPDRISSNGIQFKVSLFNANICHFKRYHHRRAAVHLWFYQQRSWYPSTGLSGHKCKWVWWPCHPSWDMDVQLHATFATTWTAVYVDARHLPHQVLNRSGGFFCRFA